MHISLTLNWKVEKNYVMTKMQSTIAQLQNCCYTRSQIMMLFNTCVVPIFWYSAPLVQWTAAEWYKVDALWSQAVKYSLRLPISFPLDPILLNKDQGGMSLTPAAFYMLKEVQIHVRQCLAQKDNIFDWTLDSAWGVMRKLGMYSAKDVFQVGTSSAALSSLASSPFFQMHSLLQPPYWETLSTLLLFRVIVTVHFSPGVAASISKSMSMTPYSRSRFRFQRAPAEQVPMVSRSISVGRAGAAEAGAARTPAVANAAPAAMVAMSVLRMCVSSPWGQRTPLPMTRACRAILSQT